MASEEDLQSSPSDHSPRRQIQSCTSSSSNSNNKTSKGTKSSSSQRNSEHTEYSEDFDDRSSSAESFQGEDEKRKLQETMNETVEKNNNMSFQKTVQTKPRFKVLQNWNQSTLKNKSQKITKMNTGELGNDSVTRHILSARLNKTKELKNEVYDLQRELKNARLENKLLRRLQYRHMKALVKFENEQNNLPQLLTRHTNEVQMLKEMLRRSKEQDRYVSKQLKEAESELWKTKNTLQKLKTICQEKDLEERDELTCKLTELTKKLEADEHKIQDLERILELKGKSFNHQLAAEHRKTREALDQIKKLEMEQRTLNQTLTEKERLLEARNIYANRITKNNSSSPRHKANMAKAIQTEEHISPINSFSPHNVLPNLEKKTIHSEREVLRDVDDEDKGSIIQFIKHDNETESEVVKLRKEYEQAEKRWKEMVEKDILENLEKEKREKQERERAAQILKEAFESKESGEQEETMSMKEGEQQNAEKARDESPLDDIIKEIDEAFPLSDNSSRAPSWLRRRYRFTEQTENLHKGLPVCKLSCVTQNNSKRRQERPENEELMDLGSSFRSYEPSFGKFCTRVNELRQHVGDGQSSKPENCFPSLSRNDKKSSLMETLFQSGDSLESETSKDSEAKASEKLKQLQRNKQSSRIQVTNQNRLNLLDPDLLPVRMLESSTDESDKLAIQSLNK
ncbi:lebercilin-like protein [Hypanus sabinus]|uniref:lebercilin-like protein n=1 Tax=Hypanus sabinus TaxID=79690 RepID=UPI0028C4D3EA|nr:lebercilin-like protein [Hypanus sabinus]